MPEQPEQPANPFAEFAPDFGDTLILECNLAENPDTAERWVSTDDLSPVALEEVVSKTDVFYWQWPRAWKLNIRLVRVLFEVMLREIDGATDAEAAAAARIRMSRLKRGRLVRVVSVDDGLPGEWDGAMPDPKAEGSGSSTTS